jgi:predicted HTH domain antitoxin
MQMCKHAEMRANTHQEGNVMQIVLDVPERYLLNNDVTEMANRLKLYGALLMFQTGQLSAGAACEFAEVDRYTFLKACKKHGITVLDYDEHELQAELDLLRKMEEAY